LQAAGFVEVSQKGSHVKFVKTTAEQTRMVSVPKHREVKVGTLRGILRVAGITPEEWDTL